MVSAPDMREARAAAERLLADEQGQRQRFAGDKDADARAIVRFVMALTDTQPAPDLTAALEEALAVEADPSRATAPNTLLLASALRRVLAVPLPDALAAVVAEAHDTLEAQALGLGAAKYARAHAAHVIALSDALRGALSMEEWLRGEYEAASNSEEQLIAERDELLAAVALRDEQLRDEARARKNAEQAIPALRVEADALREQLASVEDAIHAADEAIMDACAQRNAAQAEAARLREAVRGWLSAHDAAEKMRARIRLDRVYGSDGAADALEGDHLPALAGAEDAAFAALRTAAVTHEGGVQ